MASAEDVEFVRETGKSILRVTDKIVTSRVRSSVIKIHESLEQIADDMSAKVHIDESEIKLVSDALAAVAAKYAILANNAALITLISWGASYGVRVTGVFGDIKTLASQVAVQVARTKDKVEVHEN